MGKHRLHAPDPMGHHARLYTSIASSPAWIALSYSSRALYVQLRSFLKQTNNGNINATHAHLKRFGFESSSTLAKCLRELETVGLIEKTRQGGIANGGKVCNLFRFTDQEVFARPDLGYAGSKAGKEWSTWKSVDEATAAIKAAHDGAQRPETAHKGASKLRHPQRTDSDSKAKAEKQASRIERIAQPSPRNPMLRLVPTGAAKPLIALEKSCSSAA